jgi:hypothetical protein
MPFIKWPSINKFSDVYHSAKRNQINDVTLRGKIKLHGTNAAIRIEPDGTLVGQKKTADVMIGDDNAGFAQWLSTVEYTGDDEHTKAGLIFFGEWAGRGIQSNDAVTGIADKKFFIFAIAQIVPYTTVEDGETITRTGVAEIQLNPSLIQHTVNNAFADNNDIIVLPWYTEPQHVRMMDQDDAQKFITAATTLVDEVVGVEDPYIKETFGVSGPGEGIVYYALDQGVHWRDWMFKVKSDAHTVNKSKVRDHVAPEKPEGMDEFVEMFFTLNRFQQMLDEALDGVADRKKTGDFLKAVMSDVHKESVHEIELADFEWKDVTKYAVGVTRLWLFDEADKLA